MRRWPVVALALLALGVPAFAQQPPQRTAESVMEELNKQPTDLGEYMVLSDPVLGSTPDLKMMLSQTAAATAASLGRPNDALRWFPGAADKYTDFKLPTTDGYRTVSARQWITQQAPRQRVIMLNESHHAAQTRVLTLSLLAPLHKVGYRYLAMEALTPGVELNTYPTPATGYYTREPILAEVVREAKRLGYTLITYEGKSEETKTPRDRETAQARNLAAIFKRDPKARVLVHAGYSHIAKNRGVMIGDAEVMATRFIAATRLPVLSISQTAMAPLNLPSVESYGRRFAAWLPLKEATILVSRKDGSAWSSKPGTFDASVLLPLPDTAALRPDWLTLGGLRQETPVDTSACKAQLPCLVEARYSAEGDDAIAADRMALMSEGELTTPLYLRPGNYRVRISDRVGKSLQEFPLQVKQGNTAR